MATNDLSADNVIRKVYDPGTQSLKSLNLGQLVPNAYDYIAMTYVAAGNGVGEIETVTYKSGGAGGTTVAVLTLSYDVSNNLVSITRS